MCIGREIGVPALGLILIYKAMKIIFIICALIFFGFVTVFLAAGIMLPKVSHPSKTIDDRFVNVNGSKLRYRFFERGGRPIVFLHGFGEDLTIWTPIIKSLTCGKAYSLDLIGFGQSDRPGIAYSLETQSRYVIGFMDKMGIDTAMLVGTSMGASIAMWSAAHHPGRVDAIAVFAPSAYPGSMHHRWPGDLLYRPNGINRLMRLVVCNIVFSKIFPDSLARQALDVTASYNGTFLKALKQIDQPALLIWSKGDRRVPYEYSLRFREILRQMKFVQAPLEAGHSAARYPLPEIIDWICTNVKGENE